MTEATERILTAADTVHQSVGLAVSLLQESLANIGVILTQGCDSLGEASLGSTMRLGQHIKEVYFRLGDIQQAAHTLCLLLGVDLGVRDAGDEGANDGSQAAERNREYFEYMHEPDYPDIPPGEDEYDDDDIPF